MRGRTLRQKGPKVNFNHTVNRGSRYPIHVHQPVDFDQVTGFLTERQYLAVNQTGHLCDVRSKAFDWPIPEGDY